MNFGIPRGMKTNGPGAPVDWMNRSRATNPVRPGIVPSSLIERNLSLIGSGGMSLIIDLVARKHGVSRRQLLSRSLQRRVTAARKEAMRLCLTHTGKSSATVGRVFDRDWTTVLYAAGRLKKSRERDGRNAEI